MNLNPNHPVTAEMSKQWHKIVAILIHKSGLKRIDITPDDIEAFAQSGLGAVTVRTENEVIELCLVTAEEGEKLARQEGGLPH